MADNEKRYGWLAWFAMALGPVHCVLLGANGLLMIVGVTSYPIIALAFQIGILIVQLGVFIIQLAAAIVWYVKVDRQGVSRC